MSSPIIIRVFSEEIRFETRKEKITTIPLQNIDQLRLNCMDWAIEIARIAEKCKQQASLSQSEQAEALKALADIGQQIAVEIFNSERETVKSVLQQSPETDIQIRGSNKIWIPWELLYFGESGKLSSHNFCGFKRNIYRTHPDQKRKLEITSVPSLSLGFLAHKKMPLVTEEFKVVEEHLTASRIESCQWFNYSRIKNLFNQLKSLHIVHFAGLMTPLRYLEKSLILVELDLWFSKEEFKVSSVKFNNSPLVVFNVRDNYARNPTHVLDYVNLMLDKGASGVIASEFTVPPKLAERFTERFYSCLFEEKQSIAQALADTKSYFLEECNNPFAMFYVPYFEPPEFQLYEDQQIGRKATPKRQAQPQPQPQPQVLPPRLSHSNKEELTQDLISTEDNNVGDSHDSDHSSTSNAKKPKVKSTSKPQEKTSLEVGVVKEVVTATKIAPPSNGKARSTSSESVNDMLSFTELAELVQYLLAIGSIADEGRRATVISQLPAEIKTNVAYNSVHKVHVFNMVNICLQYPGGMQNLSDILQFFESDSIPMQAFKEALNRLLPRG